jgi:hemerythrin-like domain-containing protein
MNPFRLLKEDHKKVKELFETFEGLGDRAHKQKQEIVEKVIQELTIHTHIEEKIFYPAAKAVVEKEGKELVAEAYEEHNVVKKLIVEIQGLKSDDERYDAKFKVLAENVKHHIKEEENELFPKAQKALSDEADQIGDQMEELKQELQEEQQLMPKQGMSQPGSAAQGKSGHSHAAH